MIRTSVFLLFAIFLFSCGQPSKQDESKAATDEFRENVMMLRNAGLLKSIPEKSIDSLIGVFRKDSLNGLKQLLAYSGELLPIDVQLNGKSAPEKYAELCGIVAKKFPEFAVDSVKCWYLPEDPGGKDTGWMMMRLRKGDAVYTNKLYYFEDSPIDETFSNIFNMMLAEQQKDYRIYLVTFQCSNCLDPIDDSPVKTDRFHFGLIKLSRQQASSLLYFAPLSLDAVDQFNVLTNGNKAAMMKKFEASGLIDRKDSSWYRYRRSDIMNNAVYGAEQVYDFLDTLFAIVNFDTINDYNPYEQILRDLSHASRGHFIPDGISDQPANHSTRTVRFTLNGKVYEHEFEQRSGMLYPGVLDEVNKALEEQKAGGAFYTVLTKGNYCMVIYIDDDKLEKVKASGFFNQLEKGSATESRSMYSSAPSF